MVRPGAHWSSSAGGSTPAWRLPRASSTTISIPGICCWTTPGTFRACSTGNTPDRARSFATGSTSSASSRSRSSPAVHINSRPFRTRSKRCGTARAGCTARWRNERRVCSPSADPAPKRWQLVGGSPLFVSLTPGFATSLRHRRPQSAPGCGARYLASCVVELLVASDQKLRDTLGQDLWAELGRVEDHALAAELLRDAPCLPIEPDQDIWAVLTFARKHLLDVTGK